MQGDSRLLGLLYAAPAVGAVLVATVMSTRSQVRETGKYVLIGVAVYALCTIGFALFPVLWLSLLMLAGSGAGNSLSGVLRGTTNQLLTPDELRGRVAAINSAFVMGGPQLGQFESGLVANLWGAPASAFIGGLGAAFVALAVALIPGVRSFSLHRATDRQGSE